MKNIQNRHRKLVIVEGGNHGVIINQLAARDIDQNSVFLHCREKPRIGESARVVVERARQHNNVGIG